MAEPAKILDLSEPVERATVILPDGAEHQIRAPEDFTTSQFRELMRSFRALREADQDSDEPLEQIDALLEQIFVDPPDVAALTIGHKRRVVNFFSTLVAAEPPMPTSSPSPESSASTAAG